MFDRLFGRRRAETPTAATEISIAKSNGIFDPLSSTLVSDTTSTPTTAPLTYEGFHEGADITKIWGWAWDSARPDTPIDVDIYDGETHLATVPANLFREDLLQVGKGNGMHSFLYVPPMRLHDGAPHTIRVVIAGTNTPLSKTPLEMLVKQSS